MEVTQSVLYTLIKYKNIKIHLDCSTSGRAPVNRKMEIFLVTRHGVQRNKMVSVKWNLTILFYTPTKSNKIWGLAFYILTCVGINIISLRPWWCDRMVVGNRTIYHLLTSYCTFLLTLVVNLVFEGNKMLPKNSLFRTYYINRYTCKYVLRWGVLNTTLCDKVCQWLAVTSQWFSPPIKLTDTIY
jgi:hypothetical protein